MAHISINLLPPEFGAEEIKRTRFYKIQALGVGIILIMTFLASLTVALRILQSRNLTQIQNQVTIEEQKVSDSKNKQASLLLLKNRLTTINQYLGNPSKQTSIYNLIDKLLPRAITVNALSVDKLGGVQIVAFVPDIISLENLIDNLTLKENNENKISQVSVESLNRGRDGFYRISFKIKPR